MPSALSKILWLASLSGMGCVSAPKSFTREMNCRPYQETGGFKCVDTTGNTDLIPFSASGDLVCFKIEDALRHEEECRK